MAAYQETATAYAEALQQLESTMGTLSKIQYAAAYRRTELLRWDAREAQQALEQHIKEHKC